MATYNITEMAIRNNSALARELVVEKCVSAATEEARHYVASTPEKEQTFERWYSVALERAMRHRHSLVGDFAPAGDPDSSMTNTFIRECDADILSALRRWREIIVGKRTPPASAITTANIGVTVTSRDGTVTRMSLTDYMASRPDSTAADSESEDDSDADDADDANGATPSVTDDAGAALSAAVSAEIAAFRASTFAELDAERAQLQEMVNDEARARARASQSTGK